MISLMPYYSFIVRDPVARVDGHGHDCAPLEDDIDATLFAAGVIQRLVREHPTVPDRWMIEIVRDQRPVARLSFEAGRRVVLDPHWVGDHPFQSYQGSWR